RALTLDGTVCLSTSSDDTNADTASGSGVTMMAWIKPDSATCDGTVRPLMIRTWHYGMGIRCQPGAERAALVYTFHNNTNPTWSTTPGEIPLGQWSHVAISYDRHKVRAYVGGVLVGEDTIGDYGDYPGPFAIGCSWASPSTTGLHGALDEVALFQH